MSRIWDTWVAKGLAWVIATAVALIPILLLDSVDRWAHRHALLILAAAVALVLACLLLLGLVVEQGRTRASVHPDDQDLLDRLVRLLPANGSTLPLLRVGYPHGSVFEWRWLRPLEEFEQEWDAPTLRFRDRAVDEKRAALRAAAHEYLVDLRGHSFKHGADPEASYVPKDWENYLDVIKRLQNESMAVVQAYDDLIAGARATGLSVREPTKSTGTVNIADDL